MKGIIRLLSKIGWSVKHLKMRSDVIVTILMFINRGIKKLLGKRYGAWTERVDLVGSVGVTIVDDIDASG